MRTLGLLGILCLLAATPALAEEAPYGLRWGASVEELKTRGIAGDVQQDDGQLQIYQTNKLSDTPSNLDFARLAVDRRFGLQRILWVSKEIIDDPSGQKGLDLYKTMKASLTETYGDPKSADEDIAGSGNQNPVGFYQCLAQDGCGSFVTVWRSVDTDVRLRLLGTTTGKGRLEVVFLGPDWSDIVAAKQKKPQH